MGLDMYLIKKRYIADSETITVKINGEEVSEKIKWIAAEVYYGRKCNAVHAWFVREVQKGIDNCQESGLEIEQLSKLVTLISQVLLQPAKAGDLLPTQSGFFFGSYDYDESYFDELKYTHDALTKVIDNWNLYYRASW